MKKIKMYSLRKVGAKYVKRNQMHHLRVRYGLETPGFAGRIYGGLMLPWRRLADLSRLYGRALYAHKLLSL